MFLRYSYLTSITFSQKIIDHTFAMRCTPFETASQHVVNQRTTVIPYCPLASNSDSFGNVIQTGYVGRRHDLFAYEASGLVETQDAPVTEPCNPLFLYPSPLTLPSSDIAEAVKSLGPVDDLPDLWVSHLMDLMSSHFAYCSGVTSISTTAADAWALRRGVCQDYAHVAISMCRLVGIPARYVAGLMMGEGATHAWVEYYTGGCWRAFDPTNHVFVNGTYIKLAHGRDYADCSISRGSFRGVATQHVDVSVDVWQIRPEEINN